MLVVRQTLQIAIVVLVRLVLYPEVLVRDSLLAQYLLEPQLLIKKKLLYQVSELVDLTMVKEFTSINCIKLSRLSP